MIAPVSAGIVCHTVSAGSCTATGHGSRMVTVTGGMGLSWTDTLSRTVTEAAPRRYPQPKSSAPATAAVKNRIR